MPAAKKTPSAKRTTSRAAPAKRGPSAAKAPAAKRSASAFTDEERAAMREYAAERRRRAKQSPAEAAAEVLAKIAKMAPSDRALATRVHAIVTSTAPGLVARTWYGMPAYTRDGDVVCFFQDAGKFKARYATLGFSDKARLDDGQMWPVSYALGSLTKADEARIRELVRRAVG
jgi:uncharacterized protein YdhG (YjbR/CyaY superfamily)